MHRIHPIRLRLSNAFLVVGDAPVLVDTGSPRETGKIVAALDRCGVEPGDLKLILLTHAHTDHAGCAAELKRLSDAPVALHGGDVEMLRRGTMDPLCPVRQRHAVLKPYLEKPFEGLSPDVLLEDGARLDDYGLAGSIVTTPGHCTGSVSVVLDGKTPGGPCDAIAGDLVIGGFLGGLLDKHRPRLPYFADDVEELKRSIDRLLETPATRWWVGHGGPLEADRVRIWRKAMA